MSQEPMYSVGQYPPVKSKEDGPIPYLFNAAGPLGHLQGELHWRFFDFCRIHQIVYKEILRVETKLESLELHKIEFSGDIESMDDLAKVRYLEAAMAMEMENSRVKNFVDHMALVGLWAISEQFLGKIYRGFRAIRDGVNPDELSVPYRWDDSVREYGKIGIDLKSCENYDNANECRVVNNSIKHDPKVGKKLEVFNYFKPYSGKILEEVPLEMQRYFNGVSDFLGSLIEESNKILSP